MKDLLTFLEVEYREASLLSIESPYNELWRIFGVQAAFCCIWDNLVFHFSCKNMPGIKYEVRTLESSFKYNYKKKN